MPKKIVIEVSDETEQRLHDIVRMLKQLDGSVSAGQPARTTQLDTVESIISDSIELSYECLSELDGRHGQLLVTFDRWAYDIVRLDDIELVGPADTESEPSEATDQQLGYTTPPTD